VRSVLLVTDSEGFGGAEIAMGAAAAALARAGLRVSAAFAPADHRLSVLAERLGRTGVRVRQATGPLAARSVRAMSSRLRRGPARRAADLIGWARPDAIVVVLQNVWSGAAILDAAAEWRRHAVVAAYAQLAHPPSALGGRLGWLRDRLVPAHLSRFDVVLAVSESQAAAIRRFGASCAVTTVYQPVEAVRGGAWPTRAEARRALGLEVPALVGLAGRVVFQHKGHDMALRIARNLLQRGIPAHWAVVGDGPDLGRLRALTRRHGLAGTFHFFGWRDDLARVLPAFDVLAMPSRLEGLPLTAVEAMCARIPVVAFAVDGLRDLLDPPFAVSPLDEQRFADALAGVLRDPSTWPAEASASRAARLCDPDAVAARIVSALGT
jgi:glycosyltransferase involved in cell wall biosynthesis